jgi:hypothetical protein
MKLSHTVLPLVLLAASSVSAPAEEPLACNLNALSPAQRERHHALGEKIRAAAVDRVELSNGYSLVLDFRRLPLDRAGAPFCVVEVAEWVEMESKCCPFLDFGITVAGKGGPVSLRLTGGKNVKAFLQTELGLAEGRRGLP